MENELPCPQCGSTRSLNRLRRIHLKVKKRLEEEKRLAAKRRREEEERRRAAAEKLKGVKSAHVHGTHINYILAGTNVTCSGHLVEPVSIEPSWATIDEDTLVLNGAVMDVCRDCGTFYSPNAGEVCDQIEKETFELDPLGMLVEVCEPDEGA